MKTLQQIETEIEAILCDPSASYWLKNQLRARTDRDPLDYAAEAQALCNILHNRVRHSRAGSSRRKSVR